jgi:hypothetical protein
VARQQHDPPPDVVIPPRASAVLSTTDRQSQRDRHIRMIAEKGRMGWQKATGYGRRNLVETAIGRYKHLIGSTLRARSRATQQGEVAIAVRALNRMIDVAKPLSVRGNHSPSTADCSRWRFVSRREQSRVTAATPALADDTACAPGLVSRHAQSGDVNWSFGNAR